MNYRIFAEKLPAFRVEARNLQQDLNNSLSLKIDQLRLFNVYDLFGFSAELCQKSLYSVFGEVVTDRITVTSDQRPATSNQVPSISNQPNVASNRQSSIVNHQSFEAELAADWSLVAIEFVPGQFDQRAASAVDCVKLLDPSADIVIKSARLLAFDKNIAAQDVERVKKYMINPVESREKDLSTLSNADQPDVKPVPTLHGFSQLDDNHLLPYCKNYNLAMNADDLRCVVNYFKTEGRDPSETELRILDTYWSDHCRHTTFNTHLGSVGIADSFLKKELQSAFDLYLQIRQELGRSDKPQTLMDIATIGARYLRKKGLLPDLEESEENNACSIFVDVETGIGTSEKWLLQFKNETHNHPTEIEPFGGASTCLGGAIRDPLSGRSYVYQAMRVTGAGNIYAPVRETLEGKLPQRTISTKAAHGYSSYGNQIGLATTHVREIYHPNYVAKRLEVGAVVGAARAADVRRESPAAGDVVLLLGGRTGRDGIGGATGSSKKHTAASLTTCGSEVQKGNAPEERKIQRLFRRAEVTRLIKKCNDFGAGGVSVAIGELTDGLDIYLDRVPVKYSGLNATELAISESQERMAVVIAAADKATFIQHCAEENLEVTHVADVTDRQRLRMFYNDAVIVDIARSFIDSAGATRTTKALVGTVKNSNPFVRKIDGNSLKEKMLTNLSDNNVLSQKGLIEMFDASIGTSTVLMPFGGKTQRTETQVSVQQLPFTNYHLPSANGKISANNQSPQTPANSENGKWSMVNGNCSMMAFGYNPYLAEWSPYHGAMYAVVEAMTKVVAAGARYDKMRFSFQEYFERMTTPESWGKPLAALLGALKMQAEMGLPAIGGKDSMSGTFGDINVPPMLMAFGITTVDAQNVISPEFKQAGHSLYLVRHTPTADFLPDTELLKQNYDFVSQNIEQGNIVAAHSIGFGGIAEAVCKMAFGNNIGAEISSESDQWLFDYNYGSILIETIVPLENSNLIKIGQTIDTQQIIINDVKWDLDDLWRANTEKFAAVYPITAKNQTEAVPIQQSDNAKPISIVRSSSGQPTAYLPVFSGINCEYDTTRAFRRAGAKVTSSVFCNLNNKAIFQSIAEMKAHIAQCRILVFSGGFSAGDEPDGSGKFIANVLNYQEITEEIHRLLDRGGLILGICNGFQALVKSGLLPYGRLGTVSKDSPTLFRNDINRHVSCMATTRVASLRSPWLAGFTLGEQHTVAMSHGEGKFVVSEALAKELFANGQVAFQYADGENINGSLYSIEGIISESGQILGKMGHSERYADNLFKNISGNKQQDIFGNAVQWFL